MDNVLSHLAADIAGLKHKHVSQGGNWQGEKWLETQFKNGGVDQAWRDKYGGQDAKGNANAALSRYNTISVALSLSFIFYAVIASSSATC